MAKRLDQYALSHLEGLSVADLDVGYSDGDEWNGLGSYTPGAVANAVRLTEEPDALVVSPLMADELLHSIARSSGASQTHLGSLVVAIEKLAKSTEESAAAMARYTNQVRLMTAAWL